MRESRLPDHAQVLTATYQASPTENINIIPPTSISSLYKRDIPNSQDSFLSVASSTFTAPPLPSTPSNLSTSTTASATELTSPASSTVPSSQSQQLEQSLLPPPSQARGQDTQLNAPRLDTAAVNAPPAGNTAASPMSLDSPVNQGFKRTADGSVKGSGIPIGGPSAASSIAHKRNKSMDSHSSTRIGELSGKLKARLSYAMVKVQNGWEKQSLEELEESHSQRGSPISAPSRSDGSRLTFDSPTSVERRRRPSGVSDNSDQVMISPGQSTPSNPSRSLATTPSSHWRPATKPALNAAVNLISVTSEAGTGLAPAPEFAARRKRRSSASHAPPPLLGSNQRKVYSDLGATPRTPATPRAGILRMPSQQAEKDAVDTLLFMSSPNNSSRAAHTSQAAPSPLRPDAPQRRVMFENYPIKERSGQYQPPMPAPASQPHATFYRTDAAR